MNKSTGHKIRKINCPYCSLPMVYRGASRIQLGRFGFFIKNWDNLLSGSLDVQIYECPKCGKLEMFRIHPKR